MTGHYIWREGQRILHGFRAVCGTCSDLQTVPPLRAERSAATLRFARKQGGSKREGEREKTDYGLRATRKPTHFVCDHRSHTLEACDSTTRYERTPKNANDAIPQGGSRSGGSVLPGSQGARPIGFTL